MNLTYNFYMYDMYTILKCIFNYLCFYLSVNFKLLLLFLLLLLLLLKICLKTKN